MLIWWVDGVWEFSQWWVNFHLWKLKITGNWFFTRKFNQVGYWILIMYINFIRIFTFCIFYIYKNINVSFISNIKWNSFRNCNNVVLQCENIFNITLFFSCQNDIQIYIKEKFWQLHLWNIQSLLYNFRHRMEFLLKKQTTNFILSELILKYIFYVAFRYRCALLMSLCKYTNKSYKFKF